jgi:hypothetical protein
VLCDALSANDCRLLVLSRFPLGDRGDIAGAGVRGVKKAF